MVKQMTITPSIARDLLKNNTDNRRVRQPRVQHYAEQMLKGNWKSNTYEVIKIGVSGRVLDGQHRLLAVILANIPVNFQIVFDCDESIFDVIDSGLTRNANDVFKIEGIKNNSSIPSMINQYNDLVNNRLANTDNRTKNKMSNQDLKNEYFKRPDFWQHVFSFARSNYDKFSKILPGSVIGGFYAFWQERYPKQAKEFIDQLCTGQDINNNAIILLRQKLIADRLSQKKLPIKVRNMLIIKAWNHYIMNTNPKILKVDTSSETIKSL